MSVEKKFLKIDDEEKSIENEMKKFLLEDNPMPYRSFENYSIDKLIETEENTFQ